MQKYFPSPSPNHPISHACILSLFENRKKMFLDYALKAKISDLLSAQNFKLQPWLVTVMVTVLCANLCSSNPACHPANAFKTVKTTD